ncbi:DNA cytosine methyltransferase [Pseudofrankia sp. BMG5.36]|uniref:DNA cytosine methyltransferase n=1 Tax=Pseudofrankia sp. BMG5.36 TaxID=1834512 RepID=UPI0008D92D8C|nr:DNA cytosine methyltransferase [Pseudofrankia sp. BMG5.36]OHV66835.1 DNA (cytosine-5-)-methyltransferase [Pseudofrankia sp. BMG5.36]
MATYGVQLERSDLLRLPPCAGSSSDDEFVAWCADEVTAGRRLALDLFSGAGGLSLGLEQAGWTVVAAVDHDQRAIETHRANFRGRALQLDLSDPDVRTELVASLAGVEIDLVAGGPPCQPFSRAGASKIRSLVAQGTRSHIDPRRELWMAFLSIVLELKPRAVLMENVPDMGLADDFQTVRRMVGDLEASGYATQVRIIDTWRYGVPQHRRRLILLARRDGGPFTWPPAKPRMTVRDAIGDLPPLLLSTGSRQLPHVEGAELGEFARELRQGADETFIYDHFTRPVRDDDREAFALMDETTLYSALPDRMKRYRSDSFDDKYNRLGWDELSRTITAHIAKDGYWYIHPSELRTLTVREAARIQTFPDRFRFAGYRSDAFKQIGNAVPPLAGAAAAQALLPLPAKDPAVETQQPSRDWPDVHRRLVEWAADLGRSEAWTAVPGEAMTPLLAAACALLARPQPIPAEDMPALSVLRGCERLDEATLRDCLHVAPTNTRRRLERLRKLVDIELPKDAGDVIKLLKLRPTEAKVFKLLRGYDVLVAGASTIRVAARFLGTRPEEQIEQNPLTDGRIDLSRLVGTGEQETGRPAETVDEPDRLVMRGEEAPLRMAAIRHLGMTVCESTTPNCAACPLAPAGCAYARKSVARAASRLDEALSAGGLFAS